MSYLPEKLDEITEKVERLITENKQLTQTNEGLMEENNRLKFRLAEATKNGGTQVNTAGLTPGNTKEGTAIDVVQLKEKIDKYTVEVEECIDWLSKE